jgi:hypothetical protein
MPAVLLGYLIPLKQHQEVNAEYVEHGKIDQYI